MSTQSRVFSTVTFVFGIALGLASSAGADVWIVDDDGGAGVQFLDLPPAVAAALPGDVLRVLPGNYSGFVLDKALVVVGQNPGPVLVQGTIRIQDVNDGSPKLALAHLSARGICAHNCSVPVLLDRCIVTEAGLAQPMEIFDCADFRGQRCTVRTKVTSGTLGDGESGTRMRNSRVQASDCLFVGADGAASVGSSSAGGRGGNGMDATGNGEWHFYRSQVWGGTGGDALLGGVAGSGGDAWRAEFVPANWTALAVGGGTQDGFFAGLPGAGGGGAPGLAFFQNGALRHSSLSWTGGSAGSGSVLLADPADPSLHTTTMFPAAGNNVTFRVMAPQGSYVEVFLGRNPVLIESGTPLEDELLVKARVVVLGTVVGESVSANYTVPAGLPPGFVLMAQAEVTYPSSEVRRTNSLSLILQ